MKDVISPYPHAPQILLTLNRPTWRNLQRWLQQQSSTLINVTPSFTAAAKEPSDSVTWGFQRYVTSTPSVSTYSSYFYMSLLLPWQADYTAVWLFSSFCHPVFEEPEDPSNRSFFSEIISSISDVKFSHNGRYMMTRDYLSVKIWDLNMENRPVETYQVRMTST